MRTTRGDLLELRVIRTYFIRGLPPKGVFRRPAIKKPPTSGWGIAILIINKEKNCSTLFSPFTFGTFSIPDNCAELYYARNLEDLIDIDYSALANVIKKNLKNIQQNSKTALLVLKLLGSALY
jgi:hypothetical protein